MGLGRPECGGEPAQICVPDADKAQEFGKGEDVSYIRLLALRGPEADVDPLVLAGTSLR